MANKIQIRRGLKANLPVLAAGEFGYTTDTKELFIGNAAGGNTQLSGAPAWTAPTLLNSWINFGSGYSIAGFYKDAFGIVHLRGVIKSGVVTGGTTIFTLPAGYRPEYGGAYPVVSSSGSAVAAGTLEILANGSVNVGLGVANTYLTLESLTFRAV